MHNYCVKVNNGHKEAVRLDFDLAPAMADFRDEEAEADTVWMDPYGDAVGQNNFQDWQVGIFFFTTQHFVDVIDLGSHARGI